MVNYGIGFTDVLVSVWSVVMALNHFPEFYICCPNSEIKQKEIAQEFFNASSIGFDNCAGAIDGILIWTHMPSFTTLSQKYSYFLTYRLFNKYS